MDAGGIAMQGAIAENVVSGGACGRKRVKRFNLNQRQETTPCSN
jgi:hypothetical protein